MLINLDFTVALSFDGDKLEAIAFYRSVVYQALQRFKQGNADFSDYLIAAISQNNGCSSTASFDKKSRSEKGFDLFE